MGGYTKGRNVVNSVAYSSFSVIEFFWLCCEYFCYNGFGFFLRMWYVGLGFGEISLASRLNVEKFHIS